MTTSFDQPTTRVEHLRALIRKVQHFAIGAFLAATAFALLIDSVRFVSYPVLAVLAIAGGLVGLTDAGRSVLRGATVLLGCVTALIVFTPVVDWAVEALDVAQPAPRRADAIVVLGAGIQCSTGQLDSASLARLSSSLQLWREGIAPLITISDSNPEARPAGCPSQATVQREWVRSITGDEMPELVVLPAMRTTATEAAAVAQLQQTNGWSTVVVLTSPTHTRRARDQFRRAGVDSVVVVAAAEPQYDSAFSRPIHRIRALGLVVRELAGMAKAAI